jgi:hypothetical protein
MEVMDVRVAIVGPTIPGVFDETIAFSVVDSEVHKRRPSLQADTRH